MKVLYVTVCLAAFACLASSQLVYKDCGSKVGKIASVSAGDCSGSPCVVKKGMNYTIKVTFTALENSDNAVAQVYGILDGVSVPYPIENPNGCVKSGLECPLKEMQTYTYTSTLPILKEYPDVKVVVKWELLDAKTDGNSFFCFETLIEVTG